MPFPPAPSGRRVRRAPAAVAPLSAAALFALAPAGVRAQTTPPATAASAAPTATAAPPAVRVAGTVYDSIAGRPLAGATVQLARRDNPAVERTTVSDSLGRFALDSVAPGAHVVGFYHAQLDLLGVDLPPRVVEVGAHAGGELALATPGPAALRRALCGPGVRDSAGVVVGLVRDADSGTPIAGASVEFSWYEYAIGEAAVRRSVRRVAARTQPSGLYAACGLPTDDDLLARARLPGRASGPLALALEPGGLRVQEFALGDSAGVRLVDAPGDSAGESPAYVDTRGDGRADGRGAKRPAPRDGRVARGTARLAGTVQRPDGTPLSGAEVLVWGTGLRARADDRGGFTVAELPAGTFEVEARSVGLMPLRTPVALASGRTASVVLTLDAPVPTLSAVTVRGKRPRRALAVEGFLARRRQGIGRFITAADLEARRTPLLTDYLWTFPGIGVQVLPHGERAVRLRDGCRPQVILDGTFVDDGADNLDRLARPLDVVGVEIYTGLSGAPSQWSGGRSNGCGVIAIWTKI